jgi:adenylate cyclase class 2
VPVETEVKIRLSDLNAFRLRLTALAAVLLSARHFEDNFVLDFADGRLRSRRCLMRVRLARGTALVTYKGPPLPIDLFKKREEWETQAADGAVLLHIFTELGLAVWFRYQKHREEYTLTLGSSADKVLHIALDETPIGDFAELEGPEPGILEAAAKLGLRESEFICDSYYGLYLRHCQDRGVAPGEMVFAEAG